MTSVNQTAEERMAWALERLRHAHVRVTPVRERILEMLAHRDLPATLNEINNSATLLGQYDEATVYRTLVLLVELNVVRQLQFSGHSMSFALSPPGEYFSFLICRCCGQVTRITPGKAVRSLEQQASVLHGYSQLAHELEVYGICPSCHEHTSSCAAPSKLIPGLKLRRSHN